MLRLWPPEAMKALVAVTPLTPSCVCVSHVGGRDRRSPTTHRALLLLHIHHEVTSKATIDADDLLAVEAQS